MEFVCTDPKATVRGANIKATLDAFNLVPELGEKILLSHGIKASELTPEVFLPVQSWLNALKEVQKRVGDVVTQKVGRGIVVNADFPPHFDSVESVLMALDQIYHLNHKGEVGHYHATREKEGVTVRCETPYPRAFERGLVEGITENPNLAKGKRYMVHYEPGPFGKDLTCTLKIRELR